MVTVLDCLVIYVGSLASKWVTKHELSCPQAPSLSLLSAGVLIRVIHPAENGNHEREVAPSLITEQARDFSVDYHRGRGRRINSKH